MHIDVNHIEKLASAAMEVVAIFGRRMEDEVCDRYGNPVVQAYDGESLWISYQASFPIQIKPWITAPATLLVVERRGERLIRRLFICGNQLVVCDLMTGSRSNDWQAKLFALQQAARSLKAQ